MTSEEARRRYFLARRIWDERYSYQSTSYNDHYWKLMVKYHRLGW